MDDKTHESRSARKPIFHFWRCFWLLFLVVSLGYAWYCYYVPANNVAWAKNYDVAQTQASQDGKPVILYFTGKWCVPCRIMKREVWADDEVAKAINEHFVPVMIDLGDPRVTEDLERFGVSAAPNTIVVDSDGNVLAHRYGGMGKEEFLEFISSCESVDGP